MTKTQVHGNHILGVESIQKSNKLASNASVQVSCCRICNNFQTEFLRYRSSCISVSERGCINVFFETRSIPSLESMTTKDSLPFPLSTTCSERNFFKPFPSLPSCNAVISSTAAAVELNRCIALSFSLLFRGRLYKCFSAHYSDRTGGNSLCTYSPLAFSGVSNSSHRSALLSFAESVSLKRQYPNDVS